MLALLVAALAAASVSSAATAKTAKVPIGTRVTLTKSTWAGPNGANGAHNGFQKVQGGLTLVGPSKLSSMTSAQVGALGKVVAHANRPTRGHQAGLPAGAAPSGASSAVIPHVHSLPISGKSVDAAANGLNEFWQEATHGGSGLTPPDQALAEGNGQVLEAVNDVFIVTDTSFHHPLGATPLESLFAPAILATNEPFIGDPKAYYDNRTGRWFVTVYAFGAGGSAVDIAVSTTSDAFGAYAIYVLDTTNDGTDCTGGAGCFGDQPLLGADAYTIDISTNSFNNTSGALNGAQLYVIDKTALVGQVMFPAIWYTDIGGTYAYPGFTGNTCGVPNANPNTGLCLSSVQPATSPNGSFNPHNAGTEFMLESLDPFASVDNRLVEWFLLGTSGVSFQAPVLGGYVLGSESYGFPVTNTCMVMPQLPTFMSLFFIFGVSSVQCGFAEQPASGNTPFCDFFTFGAACEPGAIQADDDRMNAVQAVTSESGVTTLTAGLNTDAMIADPLGQLHRRDAIAWFAVAGFGGVIGQGYVGNWQNDVLYPTIVTTVPSNGVSAAMVYSVTGNNHFPSVAISKFTIHQQATSIGVVIPGQDVLDDFCTDGFPCGFPSADPNTWYRPRYGDYSAAVADGSNIYMAGEYAGSSCNTTQFISTGFQCWPFTGVPTPLGVPTPRGFASNWATGLLRTHA